MAAAQDVQERLRIQCRKTANIPEIANAGRNAPANASHMDVQPFDWRWLGSVRR